MKHPKKREKSIYKARKEKGEEIYKKLLLLYFKDINEAKKKSKYSNKIVRILENKIKSI